MFGSLPCLLLCPYYGHDPLKGMNQNDHDDLDEVLCCGIVMVVDGSHHDANKAERDASLKYSVVVGVDDPSHRGTCRGNACCCCRYRRRRLPEEATGGGNDNN
jgi:hypothetical protein